MAFGFLKKIPGGVWKGAKFVGKTGWKIVDGKKTVVGFVLSEAGKVLPGVLGTAVSGLGGIIGGVGVAHKIKKGEIPLLNKSNIHKPQGVGTMALTKGEVFEIIGRLLEKVGAELEVDDNISTGDLFELLQKTIVDIFNEYQD